MIYNIQTQVLEVITNMTNTNMSTSNSEMLALANEKKYYA